MKLYLPKKDTKPAGFHLAGIIPITSEAFDFAEHWPDSLTKINQKHSFVEYAIYKALCMGCDSIWISLERKGYTLIRKEVGEYAKSALKGYVPGEGYVRKRIPIYYWFRSSPEERKYRYMSEITKTIEMSRRLTGRLSNHLAPDRFYVSFPGCMLDIDEIVEFRRQQKESIKIIPKTLFQNNGNTVQDDKILDFVCGREEQNYFDERLKRENVGFILQEEAENTKRNFSDIVKDDMDDFKRLNLENNVESVTGWKSYENFIGRKMDLNFPDWELVSGEFKHRDLYHED